MSDKPAYNRVLIKLSGETLCRRGEGGLAAERLAAVAGQVVAVARLGVQVGLVIGGGNFLRGRDLADQDHIRKPTADAMGMLATVMNALALRDVIQSSGTDAVVFTATAMPGVCPTYTAASARRALETGQVGLFAGGTGNPFFTTDTAAALRAAEIGADVLFKATKVDGVYDSDPVTNPNARKFDRLSYQEALDRRLGIMDMTAFALCMDHGIPIVVLRLFQDDSLMRAVRGQDVGTRISR
ncbi:MAG TPA: UMP kinase [Phycisphaerae bacterium]|nr:UMP kinase [Phycisphaerae bacterium]